MLRSRISNELGAYITLATNYFKTLGWHRACKKFRSEGDITPDVGHTTHPAARLLEQLRLTGAPVVLQSSPPPPELLDERFKRGPHQSAFDYVEFLQEEFLDYMKKGFWMLLPYELVKDLPGLRLSPLGVVPQRDRRPRTIVDYSFYGINDDTVKLAPTRSMQFGKANERLWSKILQANPKFGPLYMYKLDISDGFYRVHLSTSGVPKLGVCLPPFPGLPPLVAFPLVLPMGWTESPPYFCTLTETVADLANQDLRRNKRADPHPLEPIAAHHDFEQHPDRGPDNPAPAVVQSHQPSLLQRPLSYVDVFVDDLIGLGQNYRTYPIHQQRRIVMYAVDKVFRPNNNKDRDVRQEPHSVKKLKKGDAAIQQIKQALGWDYAVNSRTLLVAPHRREKVASALNEALSQRRIGRTKWESLIGQLRSLVPGLPGSEGQFSLLQAALTAAPRPTGRVRINQATHHQLQTFQDLMADDRPTRLEELIAGTPRHIGACDASKQGAGGVWFPNGDLHDPAQYSGDPLLWRFPFPASVSRRLVSTDNPSGTITINDLETCGTILHQDVLGDHAPVAGETCHNFVDNTPAIAWRTKGSTTTTKVTASLLRYAALHRRRHQSNNQYSHLPGQYNLMGDDASRLFHLSDPEFVSHFNSAYPQPRPWKLCHPTTATSSAVISTLLPSQCTAEYLRTELRRPPPRGGSGKNSAPTSSSTRASPIWPTPSPYSWSLDNDGVTDASRLLGTKLGLEHRRMPYVRWHRRSPTWVGTTRV